MTDPQSFGAWLRRERERRGVTLRAIADRTKIGSGLLEALERGDVSRWPAGIYRRAFIRSYAETIGLDVELVLANFERLFPDLECPRLQACEPVAEAPAAAAPEAGEMRLQLAARPVLPGATATKRACVDVAFALGIGLLGFAAAGAIGFWCATAVAALVYHVCGVLGIRSERPRRQPATLDDAIGSPRAVASVVQFTADQSRSSRRARARRMVATLSAAAIPRASSRHRRAVRS